MNSFGTAIGVLIFCKLAVQLWLERLNRKNVSANAGAVPAPFRDFIDEPTYKKSVAYTLAKSRLHAVELTYSSLLLAVVLFSGALPGFFHFSRNILEHPSGRVPDFFSRPELFSRCLICRLTGTDNFGSKKNLVLTPRRKNCGGSIA